MDEATWFSSTDPAAMLRHLTHKTVQMRSMPSGEPMGPVEIPRKPPLASDRKLRLFACACCRQVWDGTVCPDCEGKHAFKIPGWRRPQACSRCNGRGRVGGLTDPRSRRAVEVAELYADGLATEEELSEAHDGALQVWSRSSEANPAGLARYAAMQNIAYAVEQITRPGLRNVPLPAAQVDLLRCVFGNPFRQLRLCGVHRDHAIHHHWSMCEKCKDVRNGWLAWNDGAVRKMAQAIYNERTFDRLPLLADALEEAGCTDADILLHCRGKRRVYVALPGGVISQTPIRLVDAGPHARGCFVLDLLTGRS